MSGFRINIQVYLFATRPDFEDDIKPELWDIFNALEFTEYAEYLKNLEECGLLLGWYLGGDIRKQTLEILQDLNTAGAIELYAHINLDDDATIYYQYVNGALKDLLDWTAVDFE